MDLRKTFTLLIKTLDDKNPFRTHPTHCDTTLYLLNLGMYGMVMLSYILMTGNVLEKKTENVFWIVIFIQIQKQKYAKS